ncbi:MAG: GTPase Era [Bacteroidota bacterium]|nr:GTPase Era [Bacteroidota bacterium]
MKSGFVNLFGKPNAGKSTLLNTFMGEKLAIVSHKVQTTRHRIKGILTAPDYQIIISDTPGIIDPRYKLHEKMMDTVRQAVTDTDLALLLLDGRDNLEENDNIFSGLHFKVPALVLINKSERLTESEIASVTEFFRQKKYVTDVMAISALKKINTGVLFNRIIQLLPEGQPFFDGDEMTDRPLKFFVGEMIREQIFSLYEDEIPYHTAVLVQEYKDKDTLTKIQADIIVQRETQKGILLGEGGKMIRQLGTEARKEIEAFIGRKVFLELFVKVRPKWRDSEWQLREYGY